MTLDATYETSYRPLRGTDKVAALLLVMGKTVASRLLNHFDATELKAITRSAAALGSVPIEVLENLVEEFASEFANDAELRGTADHAESLLAGALPPEQVADIMSDVRGSSNSSVWEKIGALSPAVLTAYLLGQHPQVLAVTLSKLGAAGAAAIMESLPRELRNEATRRLLSLGAIADGAVRLIETRINQDLIVNPPPAAGAATSRIAGIINKMAPEHVEDVLKALEADRPEDAEALRAKLFSFDDLVTLPQKTRQALFEMVPSDKIVLALGPSDADFRTNVLSSLTARARRLVENELNGATGASARDVAAARRFIVDMLLAMSENGDVELRESDA